MAMCVPTTSIHKRSAGRNSTICEQTTLTPALLIKNFAKTLKIIVTYSDLKVNQSTRTLYLLILSCTMITITLTKPKALLQWIGVPTIVTNW